VAAQRVDHFVANSQHIQQRIRHCYRRVSTLIYPPVNTGNGYLADHHDDYYLSVGRLTHTKRLDLLINACNKLGRRLLIAGEGREETRLKAIAGPTVEFLGRVSDANLSTLYANSRAFLFAADEDFGIVAVEAQSYGRPVIAYAHGGSLETIRVDDATGRSDTGVFFAEQTVDSAVGAILRFEVREGTFVPRDVQQHAQQFDVVVFAEKLRTFVSHIMENK
jgi:glycosyltransferase involved in cell wall biosynthesis